MGLSPETPPRHRMGEMGVLSLYSLLLSTLGPRDPTTGSTCVPWTLAAPLLGLPPTDPNPGTRVCVGIPEQIMGTLRILGVPHTFTRTPAYLWPQPGLGCPGGTAPTPSSLFVGVIREEHSQEVRPGRAWPGPIHTGQNIKSRPASASASLGAAHHGGHGPQPTACRLPTSSGQAWEGRRRQRGWGRNRYAGVTWGGGATGLWVPHNL